MWGKRGSRPAICAAYALALLLPASAVRAQSASNVVPAARELFDQGRVLMGQSDYAQACPKFEQSMRLDPGGGTLLNLALCHELTGKTATARAEFAEGLQLAERDNRPDRAEFARQHLEALEPKLSRLRIVVPKEVRVAGLVIRRNGVELEQSTWGEAIPVDPGEQVIELGAPGKETAQLTVDVGADADRKEITVGALEDEAAPAAPARAPARIATTASNPSPRVQGVAHPTAHRTQRWAGGIMAGTGVAALGVAAYLTARALQLKHEANLDCSDSAACHASGILESRRGAHYANASTVVGIGGIGLIGVGTYLFFSVPKAPGVRASVDFGTSAAMARLAGEF